MALTRVAYDKLSVVTGPFKKRAVSLQKSVASASSSRSIPSLDGLRALSILVVIAAHSHWYLPQRISTNRLFNALIGGGAHGVAVFFVLSGYLITSLLLKEYASTGDISLRRFYLRRSLRIFPPFYAFILVMGVLWAVGLIPENKNSFVAAAAYMWALYYQAQGYFLTHTWSLSVEELFYLGWPISFLFFYRRGLIKHFTLGLILGMPFVRLVLYVLVPPMRGHTFYMLQGWIDTMMVGCLVAILQASGRLNRWKAYTNSGLLVAAFDLCAFLISPLALQFASRRTVDAYTELVNPTVVAVAIAMTLVYVVDQPNSFAGKILNVKPMRWLGMASYSLYLWQQLFISEQLHLLPWGYLYLAIAFLFSYFLVEKPSLRLRALLEGKRYAIPLLRI